MECLRFTLYGRYAHFKNIEYNKNIEYTYEHIHKPVILGILGAIIGLKGRTTHDKRNYIEYYDELKDLKISIVPNKIYFDTFEELNCNSTGFANENSTLILKNKKLQNPNWDIYIMQNGIKEEYWNTLKENLLKHESAYPIYLGNNDNYARVKDVEIIEINKVSDDIKEEEVVINSLYRYSIEQENLGQALDDIPFALNPMYIPYKLDKTDRYKYVFDYFQFSNLVITVNDTKDLYEYKDKILYFI